MLTPSFSTLDGVGSVLDMAITVAEYGQPALALTDHGNMAGGIQLYNACQRFGLQAYPGSELYIVRDFEHGEHEVDGAKVKWDNRKDRYHLGVLALDEEGWKGLIKLSSLSHRRDHFHIKPLVPLPELLEWGVVYGRSVAITTGCYFGWVIQHHLKWGRDLDRTTAMVEMFTRSFPNLFVELQNHRIDHGDGMDDTTLILDLLKVADRLGLPVVAGQDSHYCDHGDQPVHDMMKSIAYRGGNGEDSKFPGDGFHLADDEWMVEHHRPWWERVEEGHERLLDLGDLTLPALDHYRFRVPSLDGPGLDELVRGHPTRSWLLEDPVYEHRLEYELGIIRQLGFDGYFKVVADYSSWCRDHGIFINARGSANGSLVCFLTGITNVDPVLWGVEFERFLSLDRAKPPDIDMDIESDRREDVIGYIKTRFPQLTQIGTWSHMAITDEELEKGSVFVQYRAAQRSRGEDTTAPIPAEDAKLLERLAEMDVRKSAGAHAGGFVLPGDDLAIEDMLATMLIASSNTTVTQAPMDDVEDAGYVKLDLLGLRSLTTMRRVMEMIGKDPITDGMDWIPNDDAKAAAVLRSGVADNGVFQFEGYSTARGARLMKVRTTQDAILALALFRPALMNGGQTDRFLEARKTKRRETIHPTVDDLFDDTWGVPVWQEQVLALMKRVGLGSEDRNAVLKAVKMSNDRIVIANKTFQRVHPVFVRSAMDTLGVTEEDGERMWTTVMEFTDYGFNKAHATAYGLLAYRMAWLRAHHTLEFMAALLDTWAGTDKESKYVSEAHRLGIDIHRPMVNKSGYGWTVEKGRNGHQGIRRGFRSVKGVGDRGARELAELAPFESIEDLCERVDGRALSGSKKYIAKRTRGEWSGALEALREAGALDTLMEET